MTDLEDVLSNANVSYDPLHTNPERRRTAKGLVKCETSNVDTYSKMACPTPRIQLALKGAGGGLKGRRKTHDDSQTEDTSDEVQIWLGDDSTEGRAEGNGADIRVDGGWTV